MYLFRKFNYNVTEVKTVEDISNMITKFTEDKPSMVAYDTETTGLNIMEDVPFLHVWGWKTDTSKELFACVISEEIGALYVEAVHSLMRDVDRVFAHNAQYDFHMMHNYGAPIPEEIELADSTTVFRLTTYVDSLANKGLDSVGQMHVDESAKFAGKVIKKKINEINKVRRKRLMEEYRDLKLRENNMFKDMDKKPAFTQLFNAYKKERVKYVKHELEDIFQWIDERYTEPTYEDVYQQYPELMISYAYDDVVIVLEYLEKALPVLMVVDPGLRVFNRECDLIRVVGDMERIGIKIDVPYVLEARDDVIKYRERLYKELHELMGEEITVGQHKRIIKLFKDNWRVYLDKANEDSLKAIKGAKEAERASKLIRELRTVDKWLSTYIEGMLNRSHNGRVHTSVDNSGTVSGRVTSDLQQQPNGALKDEEGNELFRPRKAFIPDEGYELISFDYSQQELRVQAYYTLLTSKGDLNLLRAYMPFRCKSSLTGEPFNYKDHDVLMRWNSGEWVLEEDPNTVWEPTDVHEATTLNAFPFLGSPDHPEFDYYRGFGKMANFLKNYGGGENALMSSLDVDRETARSLDQAYYKAFPMIRVYQDALTKEVYRKGYVENLYGRRYYMENKRYVYKLANYMVQGSCADMVKSVEIDLAKSLKGYKSKFVLPVHDEVILLVHKEEKDEVIKIVTGIMNDIKEVPWVPMRVGVEGSDKSWADMYEYEEYL